MIKNKEMKHVSLHWQKEFEDDHLYCARLRKASIKINSLNLETSDWLFGRVVGKELQLSNLRGERVCNEEVDSVSKGAEACEGALAENGMVGVLFSNLNARDSIQVHMENHEEKGSLKKRYDEKASACDLISLSRALSESRTFQIETVESRVPKRRKGL